MSNKRLTKSIKKFSKRKEDKVITITGMLGLPLSGSKTVEVPGRDGYVFVRLKDNTSEVIQAYNAEVSPIYDLPVLVTRSGNVYKVIGRNLELYRDWGNVSYLPKHGGQHSFNVSLGMGGDITWIFEQQFMPLLAYPSGTASMMLTVHPHVYEWNGQWKYAQTTGTPSFAPFVPTVTGSARMALFYINGNDNSLNIAAGAPFSNTITDPATLFTFLPDVPRSIGIPLAAVKLVTGTTFLTWENIYDVRDFYTVGMSTGSPVSAINIWDEGVFKGTADTLNVVGAVADISISGSVARLFVTGSAVGGGGAPADAEYVTTALDGTLSAEVVIPGLAGSADIAGAGGAGSSREFDDTTSIYSWSPSTPATLDYDTTVKSHIYGRSTDNTARYGTEDWSPTGAFDIRMGGAQLAMENTTAGTSAFGLLVLNGVSPGNGALVELELDPNTRVYTVAAYTYASGTPTQRGSAWALDSTTPAWLRITRDGSNNVSFWFSLSGKTGAYQLIATQSHTFVVAKRGIRFALANANGSMISDWVRTNL